MRTIGSRRISRPSIPVRPPEAGWIGRLRHSPALLPAAVVMGVVIAGLTVALAMTSHPASDGAVRLASSTPTSTYLAASEQFPQSPPLSPAGRLEPSAGIPGVVRAPELATSGGPEAVVAPAQIAQSVCRQCGTVEAITPVQRSVPTSGVGAVAGGVVGGLLGNQVGGGHGRTAMTVLGAVGGGFAGNAIERNVKKVTHYQVRVRMHDGSVRTIEQGSSTVALGSSVVIEGRRLRALRS